MAENTFYFTHDYNARLDDKIKRMLRRHNMLGYGVYWAIVEDLYNNANALQTDYEGIAHDLRVPCEVVKSVLCDFDLFVFEGNKFKSLSVQDRLNKRAEKSSKARKSAHARWGNNANALQTQSKGNAIKERKGKERDIYSDVFLIHENSSLVDLRKYIQNNYSGGKFILELPMVAILAREQMPSIGPAIVRYGYATEWAKPDSVARKLYTEWLHSQVGSDFESLRHINLAFNHMLANQPDKVADLYKVKRKNIMA